MIMIMTRTRRTRSCTCACPCAHRYSLVPYIEALRGGTGATLLGAVVRLEKSTADKLAREANEILFVEKLLADARASYAGQAVGAQAARGLIDAASANLSAKKNVLLGALKTLIRTGELPADPAAPAAGGMRRVAVQSLLGADEARQALADVMSRFPADRAGHAQPLSGVNFLARCQADPACRAHDSPVIVRPGDSRDERYSHGFGRFICNIELPRAQCPVCHSAVAVTEIEFVDCEYEVVAIPHAGGAAVRLGGGVAGAHEEDAARAVNNKVYRVADLHSPSSAVFDRYGDVVTITASPRVATLVAQEVVPSEEELKTAKLARPVRERGLVGAGRAPAWTPLTDLAGLPRLDNAPGHLFER
jgi:hypothetical protein